MFTNPALLRTDACSLINRPLLMTALMINTLHQAIKNIGKEYPNKISATNDTLLLYFQSIMQWWKLLTYTKRSETLTRVHRVTEMTHINKSPIFYSLFSKNRSMYYRIVRAKESLKTYKYQRIVSNEGQDHCCCAKETTEMDIGSNRLAFSP